MKVIILPTKLWDLDTVIKGLADGVHAIVYDYYAPLPTIHRKVMRRLTQLKCNASANDNASITDVGLVLGTHVEKAKLFDGDGDALEPNNAQNWDNFALLATSIKALLDARVMYVMHPSFENFEFAGLQREFEEQHDIKLINTFDYKKLERNDPRSMFFKEAFDKHADIFPVKPIVDKLKEELNGKVNEIIEGSRTLNDSTSVIWKRLKEILVLNDMTSEEEAIEAFYANQSIDTARSSVRSILRIMFASKRESFQTPVGATGLTFGICIELMLLHALLADIDVFATAFYGYVFGKDDELKSRLLTYIDTDTFADHLTTFHKF